MKTTRQRILDYIHSYKLVTASDICRGLRMTPENARHHLEILISQGLVEKSGIQGKLGRGRPAILYGISTQAQGHNLDRLAGALLSELFISETNLENERRLRKIAHRLVLSEENRNLESQSQPAPSQLTGRLNMAVKQLNSRHYHARWEARAESPYIFLGNCPYSLILQAHQEICRIDQYLIENLLDTPVELVAKRTPDERGVPFCLFRIRRKSSNSTIS